MRLSVVESLRLLSRRAIESLDHEKAQRKNMHWVIGNQVIEVIK